MLRVIFNNFFFDPRKLFVAGFLGSILLMMLGVMDYRYLPIHYTILVVLIVSQIPLFLLGPINLKVDIEISDKIGWAFLALSLVLVIINIKLNGLPFVLNNVLEGSAINQQSGEYYHKNIKMTAVFWPLLTILIPMSLLIKGKLIKYLLFFWAIFASALIQIKSPFIFGFIFFLIFFQITGRKLKATHLALMGSFACLLFLAINFTRTSDELSTVAEIMGLAPFYQTISPIIWLPLSYIGGPIANGFHQMGNQIINFNILPYVLTLPNVFLNETERVYFYIKNLAPLPWAATNNAVSAIGSFSHMFGLAGMVLLVFLFSFLLYFLAKRHFLGNVLLLSIFLVSIKNIALFPIGNYFIDPNFFGEVFFLYLALSFSKIKIIALNRSIEKTH